MEVATLHADEQRSHQRRAAQARRRPASDLVTVGLVALHVVAVGWLVAGGALYIDDIRAQAYAAGRPIWPFVVESNQTHLAPGARTVDWLMATYAPLEHWPAVVISLVIAILFAVSSARLLRQVVSNPVGRLLGLAWVLFAASVIPTYAWFRQALTTMLPLALVLLVTSLTLDHVRTGRRRPWVLAVLLHALALTFSERALAVPLVVLAVLLVARNPDDTGADGRGRRFLGGALTLAPHVVVNVAFLAAYTSGDFDKAEGSQPGVLDAVVKVGRWVLVDLLPSFLGGPVVWRSGNGPYSFASSPLVLVVAAAVLTVLLGAVAARTRGSLRASAPVALVAGAYAVPVLTLVYVGRLAQVESISAADDLRLLPDVSAAVAIALAALVGTVLDRRLPGGPSGWGLRARRAAAVGAATAVVLCSVTWVGFGLRWHDTPVTGFVSTMRSDVTTTSSVVVPTTVPAEIIPGWVDPAFTTAPLVRLLNPKALPGHLDGTLEVVGPTGALVPAALGRVADAEVPAGFCGSVVPVGVRSVTIPLKESAPYFRGSRVLLGVLVGDAERLNISVTGRDGTTWGPLVEDPPELLRGPHRIHALVPYGVAVESITLTVDTPNTAGVCVTSARVVTVGAGS